MIVTINWALFQQIFLNKGDLIYVIENDYSWEFYTSDRQILISCIVPKPEEREERLMFVDRYLLNQSIIRADKIQKNQKINLNFTQNDL